MKTKTKIGIGVLVVAVVAAVVAGNSGLFKGALTGAPSAAPTPATCQGPYKVIVQSGWNKGKCVWSCSTGTQPDPTKKTNECTCKPGLTEVSKDQLGRRKCAEALVEAPSFTVVSNTAFVSRTVVGNSANLKLASFIIRAPTAEGLKVNSIKLELGGLYGSGDFTNLKLKREKTAGEEVQISTIQSAPPVGTTVSFSTVSDGFNLQANESAIVNLYGDARASTGPDLTIVPSIPASGVEAVTLNSNLAVNAPLSKVQLQATTVIASGTLKVTKAPFPGITYVIHADETVPLFSFNLETSVVEAVRVTQLNIQGENVLSNIAAVELREGTRVIKTSTVAPDGSISFTGDIVKVSPNSKKQLVIYGTTTSSGILLSGSLMRFEFVKAEGVGSGSAAAITAAIDEDLFGTGIARKTYYFMVHDVEPIITAGTLPSLSITQTMQDVAVFNITAAGPRNLNIVSLTMTCGGSGLRNNGLSDNAMEIKVDGSMQALLPQGSSDCGSAGRKLTFLSPIEIPANQTKSFTIRFDTSLPPGEWTPGETFGVNIEPVGDTRGIEWFYTAAAPSPGNEPTWANPAIVSDVNSYPVRGQLLTFQ